MSTQSPFEPVRRPRARSMAAGVAAMGLFAAVSMTPVLAAPPTTPPGQDQCQEVGSNCQQQSSTPSPTPTESATPSPSESPEPSPTPTESATPSPSESPEPSPTPTESATLSPSESSPTPTESPEELLDQEPLDDNGALPGAVTPDPGSSGNPPSPTEREDVRGGRPEPALPNLNASPAGPADQPAVLPDTSMAAGSDKFLATIGLLLVAAALSSASRRREAPARI
jgi:hypothetical protein